MEQLVVIALSPSVDVSTVVGPFRTNDKAMLASMDLESKGYNTEICQLTKVADVDLSPAWGE